MVNAHGTRGHMYKLVLPLARKTVRKNFFSIRIIPAWNFLPADIVTSSNVHDFKVMLLNIDLTLFLSRS